MKMMNLEIESIYCVEDAGTKTWEAKCRDLDQAETATYIYASLSDRDTSNFSESRLKVYAYSCKKVSDLNKYELENMYHPGYRDTMEYIKTQILQEIKKQGE